MTTIDLFRRRPYLPSPRLKLGVCAGLLVRNVSFASLGPDWVTVSAVAVGTLALSIAGGWVCTAMSVR